LSRFKLIGATAQLVTRNRRRPNIAQAHHSNTHANTVTDIARKARTSGDGVSEGASRDLKKEVLVLTNRTSSRQMLPFGSFRAQREIQKNARFIVLSRPHVASGRHPPKQHSETSIANTQGAKSNTRGAAEGVIETTPQDRVEGKLKYQLNKTKRKRRDRKE